MLESMKEGGYDPPNVSPPQGALMKSISSKQASPGIWRVPEDPGVGFAYMQKELVFNFLSDNEDVFERMTRAPSLEILKGAAPGSSIQRQAEMGTERGINRGDVIECSHWQG
jgi:hypothetical protein